MGLVELKDSEMGLASMYKLYIAIYVFHADSSILDIQPGASTTTKLMTKLYN